MKIKGFTLIEVLIVIAIVAVLAAIVIVAVNPAKQFAQARNTERRAEVKAILDAVWQYAVDNNGNLPTTLEDLKANSPNTYKEVCMNDGTAGSNCTDLVDLSVLVTGNYITEMPTDPSCPASGCGTASGTGYWVKVADTGRVSVFASSSELNERIEVTR